MVPHEAQQALHRAVNHAAQQPDVTKALSDAVTERLGDVAAHEVRQVLLQAVNHAVQHHDVTKSLSNAITKELGFQVEDGLSYTLPLRPGASLSQTRKILRRCTNEAIVVSEVLAVLIPIGDLFFLRYLMLFLIPNGECPTTIA